MYIMVTKLTVIYNNEVKYSLLAVYYSKSWYNRRAYKYTHYAAQNGNSEHQWSSGDLK